MPDLPERRAVVAARNLDDAIAVLVAAGCPMPEAAWIAAAERHDRDAGDVLGPGGIPLDPSLDTATP